MAATTDLHFTQERNDAFDCILALVRRHIDGAPAPLILSSADVSASSAKGLAEREAWKLLEDGIRHLKDGGAGGAPGLLTGALVKASLRSSTLAASLGVKPPRFEDTSQDLHSDNGREDAVLFCKRLIEAAVVDIPKSCHLIQQKIALAPGLQTVTVADAALAAMMDAAAARNETSMTLRKQAVLSFNCLLDAYKGAFDMFRAELPNAFKPRTPGPAGPAFR
jgi:hypothetical protein